MVDLYNVGTYNVVGQFKYRSFPYYDQLTSIDAKDRAIGKDAQIAVDIVEEIDAEDLATANNLEEGNNYQGCKYDISLDEVDVSATQSQSSKPNQDSSTSSKKRKKFPMKFRR
ncbi:WD repeat-containing 24 [Gossypium australe]|uniref:WD repeat-containing 24 n=1 Tax=Gossypium australe TaxID=47621 RepID=A0A5B6VC86_9ROSI|nr:WD repeat-containing 24 [Gossypium australe]